MNFGQRLKAARKHKGLSQEELANISGVKQGSISKIERGDQEYSSYDVALSKALDVHPFWLSDNDKRYAPSWLSDNSDYIEGEINRPVLPRPESNAEMAGELDLWDENTPLDDDEVALPFFREVELAAGNGITEVQENHGCKLRFAKSTLRRQSVRMDAAYCVTVKGNSMEPVIPSGATIGVNTDDTSITDGKTYAIDHGGELRVKVLYKAAGGKIRLKSHNSAEYPDETYEASEIRILGRMFWLSYLC